MDATTESAFKSAIEPDLLTDGFALSGLQPRRLAIPPTHHLGEYHPG
jgi:hypothetical protein